MAIASTACLTAMQPSTKQVYPRRHLGFVIEQMLPPALYAKFHLVQA